MASKGKSRLENLLLRLSRNFEGLNEISRLK